MVYVKSNYDDWDLKLKSERSKPATPPKTVDLVVKNAQKQMRDLGIPKVNGKLLAVDGLFWKQTEAALKLTQDALNIPITGKLDQRTMFELDWRVYGDLNGNWKQGSASQHIKPGGPARLLIKGLNYNEILRTKTPPYGVANPPFETIGGVKWYYVPVDINGRPRAGARLSDVAEAFIGRSLGYEGAVKRNTVGSGESILNFSWHWTGLGGDDMADQDKDRIVEPHELMMEKSCWDYYMMRAQALGSGAQDFVKATRWVHLPGMATLVGKSSAWRGIDLLCTGVIGNRRLPDGTLMIPGKTVNKDAAWKAERNYVQSNSKTYHVAPQHIHTDCYTEGPAGSPY